MRVFRPLTRLNVLPLWNRPVSVWGSRIHAASFDRLLYLHLHRAGLMGSDEKTVLEKHVHAGMHVIDIGANIGLYSLLLSRLVGESGSVIAIEPESDLFRALEAGCRANSAANVQLFNVAAGACAGQVSLYRSLVNAGDNRVGSRDGGDLRRKIDVQAMTVDEIVAGRPVDFIKIDVQGWEGNVFHGMRQVLSENPDLKILFEFWPRGLAQAGWKAEDVLAELESFAFTIAGLEGSEPRPFPAGNKFVNLLAVKSVKTPNRRQSS